MQADAVPYQDTPSALPYQDTPSALPVPYMMALVMSQLQPVLQAFNNSLEHLNRQVGDLARDVAQLKTGQLQVEPQVVGLTETRPELEQEEKGRWDAKLDQVDQNIREVQRQLHSHRAEMEDRLHSQHAMLHYNLTSFKTDIDMKLKRHQKMLQVNLQAMNSTLTEMKLDQDQIPSDPQELSHPPPHLIQAPDTSALWDALERLDNTVVNNTVKVMSLMEDMEVTSGSVQRLQRDFKDQERRINQTARTSQIQFMETGLEVEAAKVVVLSRMAELAGNLTLQDQRMQENVEDVDYLYTEIYRLANVSGDCNCGGLGAAMAQLEKSVANVTALANDNRLALEEDGEGEEGQWGGASDWEPAVEAVQRELQEVKESVASELTKSTTMEDQLVQLNQSIQVQIGISNGQQDQIKRLVASFNSLLKDAIRHSDVLELLLGEEVLEFLEWPVQDQEAHSIPVLKEQLRQQQEQLSGHELSITSLLQPGPDMEEVPSADQPSSSFPLPPDDWTPGGVSRSSSGGGPARERQEILPPEHRPMAFRADGSYLWNLEKMVEDLQLRVVQLEQKQLNTSSSSSSSSEGEAKLWAEVTWLKRGLEEHLRVFKNVFSNADVLVSSEETLELDKLFELVKSKDGRRQKKRGGAGGGAGGKHRSRREVSGAVPVPFDQLQEALMFMGGSPHVDHNGAIVFKGPLTQDQFQSGSFTIPVGGVYLFVLTLDLRPGHAHVVLRRSGGDAPVSVLLQEVTEAGPVTGMGVVLLRAGEEVRLELRSGQGAESGDNVFVGLLLQRDT